MSLKDCFPSWLRNRSAQQFGPQFQDLTPYPVTVVQTPAYHPDNPNTNSAYITDSFFQSFSTKIASAAVKTTIIQIMPNNVYDTIMVTAFDDGAAPVLVPVYLSMDKPASRMNGPSTVITPQSATGYNEASLITAAFVANDANLSGDVSSLPTAVQGAQTGLTNYTFFLFESSVTNRPFYVWFNDGVNAVPNGRAVSKISWTVKGR